MAKDGLDEWIYYFKNNNLPTTFSAPGLESVSKKLKYDDMTPQSKIEYDAHQKEMAITYGVIETAKYEGRQEGEQKGRQEGRQEGITSVVIQSFKNGIDIPMITNITGLTEGTIHDILKKEGLM